MKSTATESSTVTTRADERTDARYRVLIGLEGLALGGCPINAIDLGRTLRQHGHAIEIFAIQEDAPVTLLPYAQRAGFEVSVLPQHAGPLRRAQQIRELATAHRADVVHVFGPWLGPSAAVAVAGPARRAAVMTNWTMDNVDYTPAGVPMILGTRALQLEAEATHRGPVLLMEPPVDLEADRPDEQAGRAYRTRLGLSDDHVVLVVVSRLDKVMKAESMDYAIQAVAALARPDLRLVIVGDGNAAAQLREQANEANAGLGYDAVIMAGPLQDPRPAYDAADITLGMGGSSLRALAHAKPLVVLGVNGFARTFAPESVDYFYDAGFFGTEQQVDPVGHLAREIEALLDPARRAELAAFGFEEVQRRFSLGVGAAKLEAIYCDALAAVPATPVRVGRAVRTAARLALHEVKKAALSNRVTRRRSSR